MKFRWEGIDKHGLKTKGECDCASFEATQDYLKARDIMPLKIKKRNNFQSFLLTRNICSDNLAQFSREFATLISAGIPLSSSLNIVIQNTEKKPMRRLICAIKKEVENGGSLSDAFRSKPHYFDEVTCSLIQVAEQSGKLGAVLDHIATYRESAELLKKKIIKAFYYPMIVLSLACAVTAALLLFVIPQFSNLFQGVGAQLPVLTQIIIALSQHIQHYGLYVSIAAGCSFIFLKLLIKRVLKIRYFFCLVILKTPLFGNVLKETVYSRCFKTLAMTLNAGVPLLNALQLTAQVAGNMVFTHVWEKIKGEIYAGQSLQQALKISRYFPNRAVQLIGIGEETGRLADMLVKLDEYYSDRVNQFINHLNQFLEPAIMIFLAVVIGIIVVSVYLPVFQLGSVI